MTIISRLPCSNWLDCNAQWVECITTDLTPHTIAMFRQVYFSGTEMFPHIHHKILPCSTAAALLFQKAVEQQQNPSLQQMAQWQQQSYFLSAVSCSCQDRLSVRLWGCQGHYTAHIKYCIWVYALHSNTYTMAFWIVVTSKLCNFTQPQQSSDINAPSII